MGERDARQGRYGQHPSPPTIAGGHHDEHREQKCLSLRLMERIEVRRMEGGEDQQERDRQRNDDGGRRPRLRLQCASLTLDLLRGSDGRLEVREQRDELATAGTLNQYRRREHVEQRLADALTRVLPSLTAAARPVRDDAEVSPHGDLP